MKTFLKTILIIGCLNNLFYISVYGQFAGGNGTSDNPFQITSHEQLNSVRNYLNDNEVHFILMNDIDLTEEFLEGGAYYNYGQGWIPIGSNNNPFSGFFNGNNFVIKGLYINRNADFQGFFGLINGANINNLGVSNIEVYGGSFYIGGLVGNSLYSDVINCYTTGIVSGTYSNIGGLVGYSSYSTFNRCYNESYVSCEYAQVGGLIGLNENSTLISCYNAGNVYGHSGYIGGLIGINENSDITDCFSRGIIEGDYVVGGLIGRNNHHSNIENCYATGEIIGGNKTGGFVGYNVYLTNISNCFSNCFVKGKDEVGGFIGYITDDCQIHNSYSIGNIEVSEIYSGIGGFCGKNNNCIISYCYSTGSVKTKDGQNINGKGFVGEIITGAGFEMNSNYFDTESSEQTSSIGATAKTTSEMMNKETFINWDFIDVWNIIQNETYPYFFSQNIYHIYSFSGINGSISPEGNVSVIEDLNKDFYITPDYGYTASALIVDDSLINMGDDTNWDANSNKYSFYYIKEDHSINVTFIKKTYTITSSTNANGIISPLGEVEVEHGTNQSFSLSPNNGYVIDSIFVDGVLIDLFESPSWDEENNTYTFTNIIQNHSIYASFCSATTIANNSLTEVRIYPSPCDNVLYVNNANNYKLIVISNLFGVPLLKKELWGLNTVSLNVENLISGIYLLNIYDKNGKKISFKIIKK